MKKVYKYKSSPSRATYIFYKTLSNILIFSGIGFLVLAFGPVLKDELWYEITSFKDQRYIVSSNVNVNSKAVSEPKVSIFSQLLSSSPSVLEPINTNFSIIIEKIGVNAPIVADVSVTNKDAYIEALRNGVAHASVSPYPSEDPGNVYLFAHASVNFWQLGRYSNVFNLLRKVGVGDKIYVYYNDEEFVYEVVNSETVAGWDVYPITRPVIEPTLTIQTCDPPGTTLNRLVVTAKLIEVR